MTLRESIILNNQDILVEDKRSMIAAFAAILLGATSGITGSAVKMDLQNKTQLEIIQEFGLSAIVNFLSLVGAGASVGMAIQAFAAGKAREQKKQLTETAKKAIIDNNNLKKDIEKLEKKISILTSTRQMADSSKATIKILNDEISRLYLKYPEEQLEGMKFSQQTQSGVKSFLNRLRGKK
ncbi:MAG: hypothetical protein LBF97_05515 [Elusimicrobiota bacterium]|jgi:hypothetical protein|nr:hypothetical protein [Elusimicrobiota bacterium]